MRTSFIVSCLAVAAVPGCIPQWEPSHKADAGMDAAGEPDSEDGGADEDASEQTRDAGTDDESDGSALELTNDSSTNDAELSHDAAPTADGGCADGYVLSGAGCRDIDECFEGTHECHMTATCENTEGGYDCTCPLGYSGGTSAGFACAPRIAVGGVDTGGAGEPHQCVVSPDGAVRCWGDNSVGQLGDGTNTSRVSPVGVLRDAALMSIGGRSACAVIVDGTLRCWGDNANGQLGDGTVLNRSEPVRVPRLTSGGTPEQSPRPLA